MFDITMALRFTGFDSIALKKKPHPFGYRNEAHVVDNDRIKKAIKKAEIVQIFHSDLAMLALVQQSGFSGQLVVYHTGTIYRKHAPLINSAFNKYADTIVCCLGDLMDRGAKDPIYMIGAVDDINIRPIYSKYDILHAPSNPEIKGTAKIKEMLDECEVEYVIDTKRKSHPQMILDLQNTGIYIEMFNDNIEGHLYGSFGMTALEAAAAGCVVVTQNNFDEYYKETYGHCALRTARTEEEFKEHIEELSLMYSEEIEHEQKCTRTWLTENHGMTATGGYMVENILLL